MDIFNEVLRPLADLAQNFHIELSEYLIRYLEKIKENHAESSLNFTYAALVLQNSCDIYGRKVDYVHQSVLRLLELTTSRLGKLNPEEDQDVAPRTPSSARRRRRIATVFCMEDFSPIDAVVSDKSLTIDIRKSRNRHKQYKHKEAAIARFFNEKGGLSHVDPVFDMHNECMGNRADFRLSGYFDLDFTLQDSIFDRGQAQIYTSYEGIVQNVPTPEYSDDGIPTVPDLGPNSPDNMSDDNMAEVVATCVPSIVNPKENTIEVSVGDIPPKESSKNENNKYEPVNNQVPAKKEIELLKLSEDRRRKKEEEASDDFYPMTQFLMSKMLRRTLHCPGVDLHLVTSRAMEEKLIKELIQSMKKRFHLDQRPPCDLKALRAEQSSFLGFDIFEEEDSFTGGTEESTRCDMQIPPTPPMSCHSPVPSFSASPAGFDEGNAYEAAVNDQMAEYYANRKLPKNIQEVEEWRASIQKRLQNDDKRNPFDVHQHGTKILSRFRNIGDEVSFYEIASGHETFDVCRLFVSSLMLANTCNVELSENGTNTLKLKLLSTERHHDMEELLVPSAQQVHDLPASSSKKTGQEETVAQNWKRRVLPSSLSKKRHQEEPVAQNGKRPRKTK